MEPSFWGFEFWGCCGPLWYIFGYNFVSDKPICKLLVSIPMFVAISPSKNLILTGLLCLQPTYCCRVRWTLVQLKLQQNKKSLHQQDMPGSNGQILRAWNWVIFFCRDVYKHTIGSEHRTQEVQDCRSYWYCLIQYWDRPLKDSGRLAALALRIHQVPARSWKCLPGPKN